MEESKHIQKQRNVSIEEPPLKKDENRQPYGSTRSVSPETREENEELFRGSYRGKNFFQFLSPLHPHVARIRVERIYWESWHTVCLAVLLAAFGTMLASIGLYYLITGEDCVRGAVMLLISVVPSSPGFYALYVLYKYVRCCKGYNLYLFPR